MTANEKNERRARAAIWCAVAVAAASVVGQAEQAPAACSVAGQVRSGSAPLPGVSVVALLAGKVIGATSTEPDGRYRLALPPGTYDVRTELTGFAPVERPLTVGAEPCTIQTADVELTLLPRTPRATSGGVATGRPRFETLNVQTQQAAVVAETQEPEREAIDAAARLLLPPGFSTEAPTDAVAVSGNMASMDRGMMGDRFAAMPL